jgi:hypothetical protein
MRQSAHGDIDHGAEIAWIGEYFSADGHSDLLLVVPQLRELTANVEPACRSLFTRPRHREQRWLVE